MAAPGSVYSASRATIVLFSPFNVMLGATVSMVTNESSVMSASVKETRPPVEFVTTIENVTFPFVSLDETGTVNVAVPPLVVGVNVFPSIVPVKLPRLSLSVSSLRVIVLPSFAKLLPELLVILRDVIFISGASIIVMILVRLSPGFPAVSASAVYV